MELVDEVLTQLSFRFRLVPMRDHAAEVIARSDVRISAAEPAKFAVPLAAVAETTD
jgi:hypothetical protein